MSRYLLWTFLMAALSQPACSDDTSAPTLDGLGALDQGRADGGHAPPDAQEAQLLQTISAAIK